MTVDTAPTRIRHRSLLELTLPPWHLEQQLTPAGVRVTACAMVITPDEDIEWFVDDGTVPIDEPMCPACEPAVASAG